MNTTGINAGIHFAEGRGGAVAAKHILAARAGIRMLEQGGNAVDAAVATAFAVGVAEPWMSGLGGIGFMVIQPADGSVPQVVDYGPVAPHAATPDMFELEEGKSTGLFPWPNVKGDANNHGWRSAVVPGTARGLALALQTFGKLPLKTVLQPAIELAGDGVPITWWTALRVAVDAPTLALYPETARTFLPDGFAPQPRTSDEQPPRLLIQPDLATTLERIAAIGADELYTGQTARAIASAMADNGGILSEDDLAAYVARVSPALTVDYRGWRVGTPGGATGGTTLARILELLRDAPRQHASPEAIAALLQAAQQAFEERYSTLGDDASDTAGTQQPDDYANDTAATQQPDDESSGTAVIQQPDDDVRTNAPVNRARRERAQRSGTAVTEPLGTSTTHLAVTDADGMVVSCTQTLLSAFGSRVTIPGTGILLNDGMYWFDPRPGTANSIAPRKRPLTNMAPLVALAAGGWPRVGIGSSGGRRIVSANVQMLQAVVDGDLSIDKALDYPRLDASGEQLLADSRLPDKLLSALADRGYQVLTVEESPYPRHFASPTAVAAHSDGRRQAASDTLMPSGSAAL